MRIALLGGTGDIGQGLALRWAYDTDHEVLIGSRDPEKARTKAEEYETELDSRGRDVSVKGFENAMAADRADVVVLAVPPYHVGDTVDAVADRLDEDTVLVAFHADRGAPRERQSLGRVVENAAASIRRRPARARPRGPRAA